MWRFQGPVQLSAMSGTPRGGQIMSRGLDSKLECHLLSWFARMNHKALKSSRLTTCRAFNEQKREKYMNSIMHYSYNKNIELEPNLGEE
jgi:hypothetical protein